MPTPDHPTPVLPYTTLKSSLPTPIRFTLALTSSAAALASAAFVALYSSVELNDANWKGVKFPVSTEAFISLLPFGIPLALFFLIASTLSAARRHDTTLLLLTSLASLFALTWPLTCLLAFRLPYQLLGTRLTP